MENVDVSTHANEPLNSLRRLLVAFLGSNILALFIGAIYEYFSLTGFITVRYAWIVLAFAWVIGVLGILFSEMAWGLGSRKLLGTAAAIVLALLLWGLHAGMSSVVTKSASPTQAVSAPVRIEQKAKDSDCSNIVAGKEVTVDCSSSEKPYDQTKDSSKH